MYPAPCPGSPLVGNATRVVADMSTCNLLPPQYNPCPPAAWAQPLGIEAAYRALCKRNGMQPKAELCVFSTTTMLHDDLRRYRWMQFRGGVWEGRPLLIPALLMLGRSAGVFTGGCTGLQLTHRWAYRVPKRHNCIATATAAGSLCRLASAANS